MQDQSKISVIIIDDEPEAIDLLELYLRHYPFVNVVGKETQALQGLELVREMLPEIVFLDIDMPDMDGLELGTKIHAENAHTDIVFTTAHQHYAYEAIDLEPLDFLTKPFCLEDLEIVIRKYNAKVEKEKLALKLDNFIHAQANSLKLQLPTTTGILIVDMKDIVYLQSRANNCNVYLQDGTVETVTRNLYVLVGLLNSSIFFQTSRSTYINLNYLQRVDKKNNKCILAFNRTNLEIGITRSGIAYFEKIDLFPVI